MSDDRSWWPEGYDLPAFRVRRGTYSEMYGGDWVRGSSVETLPHTALRYPTLSLDPGAIAPQMRGRVFAKASDESRDHLYNSIEIEWNWPSAVEDTFQEVAIVRSSFGAPAWPNQGQTIFRALRKDLPTMTVRESTVLAPAPIIQDRELTPGRWYYYTAFFRTNPIDWTALASDAAVLPHYYGHDEHLWNALPPYYQWVDDNQRVGEGFLRTFLDIFGFELDKTREYVESVLEMHNVDESPMPLLKGIGANYGYPYEAGLGDILYRALLANISPMLSRRGTARALLEVCETVSKYDCDRTKGTNIILLPDTSNFVSGIGQWKPAHPDLDLSEHSAGIVPSEYLTWDKVKLIAGRSTPPPPPAGAVGSMYISSLAADTGDIFITAGAGKYMDDEGVVTESTPLYGGIPVHPGEVYGMSLWVKMVYPSEVVMYLLPFNKRGTLADDVGLLAGTVEVPPDSDWIQIATIGQMPEGTTFLVPAIYFKDRVTTGGLGGRTPDILIGAVMVYHILSEAPLSVVPPDRYLTLGVSYMRSGETTLDDGTGQPYQGFVIGAPAGGDATFLATEGDE